MPSTAGFFLYFCKQEHIMYKVYMWCESLGVSTDDHIHFFPLKFHKQQFGQEDNLSAQSGFKSFTDHDNKLALHILNMNNVNLKIMLCKFENSNWGLSLEIQTLKRHRHGK